MIIGTIRLLALAAGLLLAISYVPSRWFLEINSLSVIEVDGELQFALHRVPRFGTVTADWTTEGVALVGEAFTCPVDPSLGYGRNEYEPRPETHNVATFSAEWLRDCLKHGPVEIRSTWRVVGPFGFTLWPKGVEPFVIRPQDFSSVENP